MNSEQSEEGVDSLEKVITDLFSCLSKNYKIISFVLFLSIGALFWFNLSRPKDEDFVNESKRIEQILNLSNSSKEDTNDIICFAENPLYLKKYGVEIVQYLVNNNEISVARNILSKMEKKSLYALFSSINLDVHAGDLRSAKDKSELLAGLLKGTTKQDKLVFFNVQQQRYINHLMEE